MTKPKRYKRYSPEFKREALKRSSEDRVTDKFVCEELGISSRQLGRWRDELRLLGDYLDQTIIRFNIDRVKVVPINLSKSNLSG